MVPMVWQEQLHITKDASDLAETNNPYLSSTVSYDDSSDSTKVGVLGAFVGNNIEGLIQLTR